MPFVSIATFAAWVTIVMLMKRSAASNVFPPGCGATLWCSIFVEWLRDYNSSLPSGAAKVGFYGLDLYSLYTSIEAVLGYLDKIDPAAAKRARYRYSCFEHFAEDTQAYGYAANFGITESCERDVIEQLVELRRRAAEYANRDGRVAQDEFFF